MEFFLAKFGGGGKHAPQLQGGWTPLVAWHAAQCTITQLLIYDFRINLAV